MTTTEAASAWKDHIGSLIANADELTIEDVPHTVLADYRARVRKAIKDNSASIESLLPTGLIDKKMAQTIINQNKLVLEFLDTTGPV